MSQSPEPLDALSALVMVAHANPEDMIHVRTAHRQASRRTWQRICLRHLQDTVHRERHENDAKQFPPTMIDRIIASDDIENHVRLGRWQVASVSRPLPGDPECLHCALEQSDA